MNAKKEKQSIRGFLFASTNKTQRECFERSLFGTERFYGPIVIRIRKGDLLFLNNLNSNSLHGVFKAASHGGFNIQPEAWGGKYPYQVEVEALGERIEIKMHVKY